MKKKNEKKEREGKERPFQAAVSAPHLLIAEREPGDRVPQHEHGRMDCRAVQADGVDEEDLREHQVAHEHRSKRPERQKSRFTVEIDQDYYGCEPERTEERHRDPEDVAVHARRDPRTVDCACGGAAEWHPAVV